MKSEKQLYQWDVNQYLTELQPTAQFVDYPMGNEVIRIETDGKRCRSRSWRLRPQKKMINGMPPSRWFFRCQKSRSEVIPCECT